MQYAVIINYGSNAEILLKGKNILLFVGVWENFKSAIYDVKDKTDYAVPRK